MKKFLSVLILLAFFGSTVIMTGCFGGSDGTSSDTGTPAVMTLSVAATSPGGTAAFAANSKTNLRPAISIMANNVNMKVTALSNQGVAVPATMQTIASNSISFDPITSSYKCNVNLSTIDGYNQYLIEVCAANNCFLKCIKYIFSSQKKIGAQVTATVNTTSTAQVLTYDKWKANAATAGASSYTFADFTANQTNATQTNFNNLKTGIDNELIANGPNANLGNSDAAATAAAFQVSNTIQNQVMVVRAWGNNAPVAYKNQEIFFATNRLGTPDNANIGLCFIAYQYTNTYSYRLANYFHFYPEPNQNANGKTIIAYAGNGINIDQANTVPTAWYTNSFQAKGSEMAAGDVYYFRIEKEAFTYDYGAIKIDSINSQQPDQPVLYFHYKYNRTPGSTDLTVQ